MTDDGSIADIDVGNTNQTRMYKNVMIHIEYRPKTKDFRWYFTQTRRYQIDGQNNTIDKCIADAKKYIDKMQKPSKT